MMALRQPGWAHLSLPALAAAALLSVGCGYTPDPIPCYPPDHYKPSAGAGYTAEEVRINAPEGHTLAGTLTLPKSTPPHPVVVLVTGSSKQDRDHVSSSGEPFVRYRPYRQIAGHLSGGGIGVLRMDDQGVGCSTGRDLAEVTIQERADDNRAMVDYMRKRADINPARIALLGLSEGANITALLASEDSRIQSIVMMAGSATSGLKIREYQVGEKLKERADLSETQRSIELERYMAGVRRAVARGEGTRHARSFLSYTPLPVAAKVRCPTLIMHGDRDANVPVDHAYMLARAMRVNGNSDVTVRIFKDHNHLFLPDPDGRISGYSDLLNRTYLLHEEVLETIFSFLEEKLL